MIKHTKFLIVSLALLVPTGAYAADAVINEVIPEAVIEVAPRWSGFYVGAHGTYGWGNVLDVNNPNASEQNIKGYLGGIQVGYNYQFENNVVLGAEADIAFGDINKKWVGSDNIYDPYYGEDKISALGTVRARLGYAFGDFLPYVTGGLAVARTESSLGCDAALVVATTGCQNRVSKFDTSESSTRYGYTIGGGVEYAINENWSFKTEYLYTDLGKKSVTLYDPNWPNASDRNLRTDFHTVRVGINYKF